MKRSVQRNHPIYLIVVPGNHDVVRQNKGRIEDARRIEAQNCSLALRSAIDSAPTLSIPSVSIFGNFSQIMWIWAEQVHSQTKFENRALGITYR